MIMPWSRPTRGSPSVRKTRRSWRRRNGWVFAGMARVLAELPADHADRARYITLYREMAEKITALQGEDGYWRASLLDPVSRPNPETSGTGFFVYGLAWGINHG